MPDEAGAVPAAEQAADAASNRKSRHGHRQGGDANSGGSNDQPDPVMAADINFRHQVSLPDFMEYLSRRFEALDVGRHGQPAKPDILRLCQP